MGDVQYSNSNKPPQKCLKSTVVVHLILLIFILTTFCDELDFQEATNNWLKLFKGDLYTLQEKKGMCLSGGKSARYDISN